MTLQLALNEAAKKQGYKNWNEVENKPAYGGSSIRAVACIAAELYAASKAKEAYNQGVRDAAESAKIICVLPDGVEVNDSDDIVNIPEGELTNLKISVNKNSILKLLK